MLISANELCLERVAEELMGPRKWKIFQESLTRTHLNANITNLEQNEISNQNKELDQKNEKETSIGSVVEENHIEDIDEPTSIIKRELTKISDDEKPSVLVIKKEDTEEKLFKDNIKLNNCTSQTNNKGVNVNVDVNGNGKPDANGIGIVETNNQYPIDWKPDDKCYFCVDGKLLTVNEKGDLVAESGPALSEAELANRTLDTDSDSSDSSPDPRINANKANTSRLGDSLQQNMTSFESVAAQLAAFQSMQGFQPGLGQLYPGLWYQHQLAQQINSGTPTTSETSAPALSPSPPKDSPSPTEATGEQPLDLSAKASPNSSAGGDHKSLLRSKPRMTAVTNRRTYTEEELNSALQDIITGKLGTRRAAVLYGIPRSTLRNKVYKIAMEQKRATPSSLHPHNLEDLVDGDDDDKELSGEDEINEKSSSLATRSDDLAARFATSHSSALALQKIIKPNDSHTNEMKATTSLEGHSSQKQQNTTPHSHSQTPPVTSPWNIDPNVLLFLSGMGNAMNSNMEHDPQLLRELITSIIMKSEEQKKATADGREAIINNGKANMIDPRLQQQFPHQHQQHQHKQHQQQHSSQHHSGHSYQNRLPKSETPETVSSIDLNDSSDDPSVILKIPSYKPVAGSSTSSNKNGDGLASPSSKMASSMLASAVSNQKSNNITGISPPSIRHSNDSQSSPNLCLKDVIANSICRTFSQQANREGNAHKHNALSPSDPNDQHKRPSISVLKNIGGTDISRFASTPNLLGSNNLNHHHNSQNLANNAAGGKGTRPKRGKYRNYDRDSLIEAVKAVQRGEMSVHRAGSYYGVPHSTLEYKVKERHLMRPRKREPKPQPLDERSVGTSCVGGNNGTSSTSSKTSNIPNLTAVNSLDKLKASSSSSQKQSGLNKNNSSFPNISANGMKRPIFDPAMAAQLQYANPLIFWQHSTSPAFAGLPIDFQRTQAAAAAAAAGNSQSFPENIFASQIMQRFQDETNRLTGGCNPSVVTPATNNNKNSFNNNTQSSSHETSPSPSLTLNNSIKTSGNSLPTKTSREIAETLYDNGGANGSSFLDGIIRKTLDRKSTDRPHGALLDQLVKNSKPPVLANHNEHLLTNSVIGKTKRPASPGNYSDIDIKRERSSPPSTDTSASSESEKNHPISINEHHHHQHHQLHQHHQHHQHHHRHQQHHHRLHHELSDNENDSVSDSDSLDKDHHHHSHHHRHHNKIRRQLSVEELNGDGSGGDGDGDGDGEGDDNDVGGSGCGNANSLLNSISSNCGTNSILHDQLEQIKSSETDDSL